MEEKYSYSHLSKKDQSETIAFVMESAKVRAHAHEGYPRKNHVAFIRSVSILRFVGKAEVVLIGPKALHT
jgi:hypothetical protein